jgi:hypothetical protein
MQTRHGWAESSRPNLDGTKRNSWSQHVAPTDKKSLQWRDTFDARPSASDAAFKGTTCASFTGAMPFSVFRAVERHFILMAFAAAQTQSPPRVLQPLR